MTEVTIDKAHDKRAACSAKAERRTTRKRNCDASEDKSVLRTICDEFGDIRVKYLSLPANNGISENTNGLLA